MSIGSRRQHERRCCQEYLRITGLFGHIELLANLGVRGAGDAQIERLQCTLTLRGVFADGTVTLDACGQILACYVLPPIAEG